jgi:hypothetical protein
VRGTQAIADDLDKTIPFDVYTFPSKRTLEFREEDHPRDDAGKFTDAGGGSSSAGQLDLPGISSSPRAPSPSQPRTRSGSSWGGELKPGIPETWQPVKITDEVFHSVITRVRADNSNKLEIGARYGDTPTKGLAAALATVDGQVTFARQLAVADRPRVARDGWGRFDSIRGGTEFWVSVDVGDTNLVVVEATPEAIRTYQEARGAPPPRADRFGDAAKNVTARVGAVLRGISDVTYDNKDLVGVAIDRGPTSDDFLDALTVALEKNDASAPKQYRMGSDERPEWSDEERAVIRAELDEEGTQDAILSRLDALTDSQIPEEYLLNAKTDGKSAAREDEEDIIASARRNVGGGGYYDDEFASLASEATDRAGLITLGQRMAFEEAYRIEARAIASGVDLEEGGDAEEIAIPDVKIDPSTLPAYEPPPAPVKIEKTTREEFAKKVDEAKRASPDAGRWWFDVLESTFGVGNVPSLSTLESMASSDMGITAKIQKVESSGRNGANVEFGLYDKDDVSLGYIGGVLDRDGDTFFARDIMFFLKESAQGDGVAQVVMRPMLSGLRAMGFDHVDTATADVGRYAWARAGFDWSHDEYLGRRASFTRDLVRAGAPEAWAMRFVADHTKPREWADVVIDHDGERTKVGKEHFLSNAGWDGRLYLRDGSESWEYVRRRIALTIWRPGSLLLSASREGFVDGMQALADYLDETVPFDVYTINDGEPTKLSTWNEEDHPRDEAGKFTDGSGAALTPTDRKPAASQKKTRALMRGPEAVERVAFGPATFTYRKAEAEIARDVVQKALALAPVRAVLAGRTTKQQRHNTEQGEEDDATTLEIAMFAPDVGLDLGGAFYTEENEIAINGRFIPDEGPGSLADRWGDVDHVQGTAPRYVGTLVHEVGHALVSTSGGYDWRGSVRDPVVTEAFEAAKEAHAARVAARREGRSIPAVAVSGYALVNEDEYVAECFAAYSFAPETLLARDPKGHAMIGHLLAQTAERAARPREVLPRIKFDDYGFDALTEVKYRGKVVGKIGAVRGPVREEGGISIRGVSTYVVELPDGSRHDFKTDGAARNFVRRSVAKTAGRRKK